MRYAHLHTLTNYTFLTGASFPDDYVRRAYALDYDAICIADECSLAGVVKAFSVAQELNIKLIIGSRFQLSNGMTLLAIAPDRKAYAELSGFITLARRRMPKGKYEAHFDDLRFRLKTCLIIYIADQNVFPGLTIIKELRRAFPNRVWFGINHRLHGGEQYNFSRWASIAKEFSIPLVACGEALMHIREKKPLQDILVAIRHNTPVQQMGTQLEINGESYLKSKHQLRHLYPESLLQETLVVADRCEFSLAELKYQYPRELVPEGIRPAQHLKNLVSIGKKSRWPKGVPPHIESLIEKELSLIEELEYEFFFLTVYDVVKYARDNGILCQGRGSAANSVVCYCLFITEIEPGLIGVLFERFISSERNEPPDIDVDFEHQRREEVIQYIYKKYGRERAALAATVITYRSRSAIRDVGKALGLKESLIDHLAKNTAWWDSLSSLKERTQVLGIDVDSSVLNHFFSLIQQIYGFPRHLSQHTGGFVISETRISELVPLENASMPDRTVIQWDKEDLETMQLLKVDVLALGMLSALRRSLVLIKSYNSAIQSLQDIPREDPETYDMLCRADCVGVFQVESRAQMAMLPRLRPRHFYDLVIEIAIVRPGPIQGDMVHPYLRRKSGKEEVTYPSDSIKDVLEPTLGVPIFQEQVMRLSMVAAGFSGGEADQLRRAITNWGKNSKLLSFEKKFKTGLLSNGYSRDFADRLFEQVKGFGGYGFPESHSASFAILCYLSSWIKCHHPAAFYCALLNSQPMGFYSPSQIIQDAKKHGIVVKPVDVNRSGVETRLIVIEGQPRGLRLGFHLIKSLRMEKAIAVEKARYKGVFISLKDLQRRAHLSTSDLAHLANADALSSLAGNRYQSRWNVAGLEADSPLFEASNSDIVMMDVPALEEDVINDYATVGLTLRDHPMALLRQEMPFRRCILFSQLTTRRHKSFVRVSGLVTGRQRPGSASGVLFMSLEDETGTINVVVWNSIQERYRNEILKGKLLVIKGTVEILREDVAVPIVHVIAGHIQDVSHRLQNFSGRSRNFH